MSDELDQEMQKYLTQLEQGEGHDSESSGTAKEESESGVQPQGDEREIYSSDSSELREAFARHNNEERPKGLIAGLKYDWENKAKPYLLKNNKKNLKRYMIYTVSGLLVLVLLTGGIYAGVLMNKLHGKGPESDPGATIPVDDEVLNPKSMNEVTDPSGLNDWLYKWQNNGGELMKSKNVINVLLIGVDSTDGKMTSGRSDSIMIASVNKKTQKITMISVLRDCYVYMKIGDSERYDKLNHSYIWGGPDKLREVIESLYKIKLDYYVSVDFVTFPKLIDDLGGVTVKVTQRESDYNRTKFHHTLPVGDAVTLTGKEALMFSRIRKLDGDDHRARRQRDVISAIIKKSSQATVSQLNAAVGTLLDNILTDFSAGSILDLGTQALTQKWMDFEQAQYTAPSEEHRIDARMRTWAYSDRALDVWLADFVLSAKEVQTLLYGQSNIVVSENHNSPLGLTRQITPSNPGHNANNNDGNKQQGSTTVPTTLAPPTANHGLTTTTTNGDSTTTETTDSFTETTVEQTAVEQESTTQHTTSEQLSTTAEPTTPPPTETTTKVPTTPAPSAEHTNPEVDS